MKKIKLVITETQQEKILNHFINENDYSLIVNTLVNDLNKNYVKNKATVRSNEDYKIDDIIMVKADNSVASPNSLLNYLHHKYHDICSKEFIKQVISDWFNGTIKNGILTKNIPIK